MYPGKERRARRRWRLLNKMRKGIHPGHEKLLLPGLHGSEKSSGFSGGFVAGGGAASVLGAGGGYLQILASPGPVHHPQHGLCASEQQHQAAASFIYSTPHGPAARAGLLQPTLGRPPVIAVTTPSPMTIAYVSCVATIYRLSHTVLCVPKVTLVSGVGNVTLR